MRPEPTYLCPPVQASWRFWTFSLCFALLSLGCGQPKSHFSDKLAAGARSLNGAPAYYHPGESMTWELRYLGMAIGRARLAVGIPGLVEGLPTVGVVAQAETVGVLALAQEGHDVMFSWLSAKTGVPRYSESELKINEKHVRVVGKRAKTGPVVDLHIQNFRKRYKRRRHRRLPSPQVHDTLSSLLAIRGWEAKVGDNAEVLVLGGARLWHARLEHKGFEKIELPWGDFQAHRIDGHAIRLDRRNRPDPSKQRTFTLWISDDTDKVLLRFKAQTEYGDLEMVATSHQSHRP